MNVIASYDFLYVFFNTQSKKNDFDIYKCSYKQKVSTKIIKSTQNGTRLQLVVSEQNHLPRCSRSLKYDGFFLSKLDHDFLDVNITLVLHPVSTPCFHTLLQHPASSGCVYAVVIYLTTYTNLSRTFEYPQSFLMQLMYI